MWDAKKYYKLYPWKRVSIYIKSRCNNSKATAYKHYGGKGIKCLITENELKELWFRDKAYLMKKPSIDRINSNKNYTFSNCRFKEQSANTAERNTRVTSKPILQFDLHGNFIKKWLSQSEASKKLNISQTNIWYVMNGIRKTSGGFIWKYK